MQYYWCIYLHMIICPLLSFTSLFLLSLSLLPLFHYFHISNRTILPFPHPFLLILHFISPTFSITPCCYMLSFSSFFFPSYPSPSAVEHFRYDTSYDMFKLPPLKTLPIPAVFATMGLGFSLSMLFFMDQNIGSAMVNNPCNK